MSDEATFERIRQEIADNPVVLYMKGSPIFPQCGFSAQVVEILIRLGVQFESFDVLMDPGLREGIKKFSDWPTIPQLFVKGAFVGGADIVRETYETGELKALLDDKGIETRAA